MRALRGPFLFAALVTLGCSTGDDDLQPPPDSAADSSNTPDTFVDDSTPSETTVDSGTDTTDASTEDANDAEADAPIVPETCGNHIVDPGEDCDDGNGIAGDGCSSDCKSESKVPGDVCPGVAIPLFGTTTRTGHVDGTTAGATDNYTLGCNIKKAPDVVHVITSPIDGLAKIAITGYGSTLAALRTDCTSAATETRCLGIGTSGTLTAPVTAGKPLYVIIDGYDTTGGSYAIDVTIDPITCGDGVAQSPETCDDGNTVAGDGCSPTCTLEGSGAVDHCPGQPYALKGTGSAPRKISFAGDTTTGEALGGSLTGDGNGCRNNYTGPNHMFAVKADIAGHLAFDLSPSYNRSSLYAWSECGDRASTIWCTDSKFDRTQLHGVVPVKNGDWVYIGVDGYSTADGSGPYTLDVTLTPGMCGDDVVDGGEQCDDGNATSGDGCSSTCTLEAIDASTQASLDVCPGKLFPLVDAGTSKQGRYTGSTALTGLASNFTTCAAASPDVVHRVHADFDGIATVKLSGAFAAELAVRTACTNTTADQLSCSLRQVFPPGTSDFYYEGSGYPAKTASFPVLAGKDYFLVVNSVVATGGASRGVYELDVRVDPAVCGDGALAGGEQCDDGNTTAGDGCDATCVVETPSGDTCANAVSLALSTSGTKYVGTLGMSTAHLKADSTFAACASAGRDAFVKVDAPIDGVLVAKVHGAVFDTTLGAYSSCGAAPITCSNAAPGTGPEQIMISVEAGKSYYLAVDAPVADAFGAFALDVSIAPSVCGDGFRSGTEDCDDGDVKAGDGCSATCTAETLTAVDDCPGYAVALTGTGTAPRSTQITVDTRSLASTISGLCGGSAPEGVLKVTSDISGTLKAQLTQSTYSGVIYARKTCTDPYSELRTVPTCPVGGDLTSVSFVVAAGTPYYLFVDGLAGDRGVTGVQISVTP
jgi:cysteine-rich repeat protein